MAPSPTPENHAASGERPGDAAALALWYELGMLYALTRDQARRATMAGFASACVAGALVLLSAPLFGTAWAGSFAAVVPVAAGALAGGGLFAARRYGFLRRRASLARALAGKGEDAARPTARGLGAYYDAQLLLLRCEYERAVGKPGVRADREARMLRRAFGFVSEDGFECGPLNVRPDTEEMRALRRGWERRLEATKSMGGGLPSLGLKEDHACRVFPREMTVPFELATRGSCLAISLNLFRDRYNGGSSTLLPDNLRRRVRREAEEYRALTGR